MPWTTPETFTAGQTLTAASMNLIQGNLNALYKVPMARVSRVTSDQSVSSYPTYVAWNNTSATYDTDGMWASGDNTKLTAKTAGVYVVVANLRIDFGGNMTIPSVVITYTTSGGSESVIGNYYLRLGSGYWTGTHMFTMTSTYRADVNGYFRVRIDGLDGATSPLVKATGDSHFAATWVGNPA